MKKVIVGLSILISFNALAQNGWKWPEDKETAQTKNALYTDYLKAKNYKEAVAPFTWLLDNAPDLSKSLYQNGVKLYKALAKAEKDEVKKEEYQQKVMELYDGRMKYYNQKATVMNMKGRDVYAYYKKDKDKYQWSLDQLKQAVDLNGKKVYSYNLVGYFDMLRKVKLTFKEISDEKFIEEYQNVISILDQKLADGEEKKTNDRYRDNVQTLFVSTIKFTCEKIDENFGEKLRQAPDDYKTAKLVFDLSVIYECTRSPLFFTAAEAVNKQEPDFGINKLLGSLAMADKDYSTAERYFNQALELAGTDGVKKGDILLRLAKLASIREQKAKSRDLAYQAMKANSELSSEGYNLIGNLYLSSFDTCSERVSQVTDRAVYLRAYDMFKKAGNTSMMSKSEGAFPSMEDIFNDGKSIGDPISVGCWIGEVTTIRKRP